MTSGHISEVGDPEDPKDIPYPHDEDDEAADETPAFPLRGAVARKAALQRNPVRVAKTTGTKGQARKRLLALEKRRKALELRKAGATYESIAQHVGYKDGSGAYKAVQKAFRDVIQEPVQELRTVQIERLNHMLMTLWPKVQNGDERAIATSLSVMDKIDRLMGTDQAGQVEVNIRQQSAVLVVDGNKDDYIAALKRMSGAGVQADGTNQRAITAGPVGPQYPPGMGGEPMHPQQVDDPRAGMSTDDVVDAVIVEDEPLPQQDDESLRHPTEVSKEPETPRRKFNFGMDPTIKRSQ